MRSELGAATSKISNEFYNSNLWELASSSRFKRKHRSQSSFPDMKCQGYTVYSLSVFLENYPLPDKHAVV